MSAINSPDQLVKRRSAAAANQPKNYATSPSDASKPSSFKRVWLLLAATGLLAGHFYYRSSSGNASVTDSAAHAPKTEEEKMAFDEVNKKLRMKEAVYPVNAGSVVERYEINYIPSNNPFEDYHDEKRSADGSRFFFGMYDGHGGWEAAKIIQEYLSAYVAFEVENAVGKELPLDAKLEPAAHAERRKKIDAAITRAFLRLDGDLLNGSLVLPGTTDSMPLRDQMRSSFAGACGLFAFIDGLDLYVACAGDARAVLGRRTGGGYETVALSQDQTPRNADELRRLMLEHPGEEHSVVMNGRVLGGLMPSRAFGDSRYKYSLDIMTRLLGTATSRSMPRNYLTPPYVTALPVIVHHTLDSRDAFMVLATDGLWDEIESEDAVAMLADFSEGRKPVGIAQKDTYVKMDGNAATHLIRNGFGGGNHVRVQQLLRLQPPISRRYRDDVTTTVVFFDPEVLEAASKGDKAALEKMAQAKAAGQMMVVDPKKGDPRGKTPRMDKWLKMAETERRAAKL